MSVTTAECHGASGGRHEGPITSSRQGAVHLAPALLHCICMLFLLRDGSSQARRWVWMCQWLCGGRGWAEGRRGRVSSGTSLSRSRVKVRWLLVLSSRSAHLTSCIALSKHHRAPDPFASTRSFPRLRCAFLYLPSCYRSKRWYFRRGDQGFSIFMWSRP
jgi:hypothetical protein